MPPGNRGDSGRLVHCPRCPAVWLVRPEGESPAELPTPPPLTRRGPLIVEGRALPGIGAVSGAQPAARQVRPELRRYGIAAGAAMLMLALVAALLLAPDSVALPGISLLEGVR